VDHDVRWERDVLHSNMSIIENLPLAGFRRVGSPLVRRVMLPFSSIFSICFPLSSVLSESQHRLWLLKSPTRRKGGGSCDIIFSISRVSNLLLRMYILHMEMLHSSLIDTATTSKFDWIVIGELEIRINLT